MHELALAQNIIELLEEQAVNHQFSKVKQVWLEIGVMACVEVPALHFGLDVAARHTLADNARFHITIAPAQGWCQQNRDASSFAGNRWSHHLPDDWR